MKTKDFNKLTIDQLTDSLEFYLNSLESKNEMFHFYPAEKGLTEGGKNIKLGFSCYALKIIYILNKWDNLENKRKQDWVDYINSFQKKESNFSSGSFVDNDYINYFNKQDINTTIRELTKKILNNSKRYNFDLRSSSLPTFIRAESKQAISTLNEVGEKSKFKYDQYPNTEEEIVNYLEKYDWTKPWSAAAQFAGLCVFSSVNNKNFKEEKKFLLDFIDTKVNNDDGGYYIGNTPNLSQLINGTMKTLTGLDWLDTPIHYPEKIIDVCINNYPSSSGCDLVDYVYVLYRCSLQTNYKRKEIVNYLLDFRQLISKHFYNDKGGFSYEINKSQKFYYGVKISTQNNVPDLHGTLLLTWALSMIFNISEKNENNWNILKP